MKYAESVYTANGSLRCEPAGNAVRVVASTFCAGTAGSERSVSTALSLREAVRARRALTRTIRLLERPVPL